MNSILDTVKKQLGLDSSDDSFDTDIIVCINTIIANLNQLGIGPKEGFAIEDNTKTWNDYIGDSIVNLEGVKSYIYLKTKMLFDPPASSTIQESIKESLNELEWRIMLNVESEVQHQNE